MEVATMEIAIVGRGRLGLALGIAAARAEHGVRLLRRTGSVPRPESPIREAVLDDDFDWASIDLVLLAFEAHAESADVLAQDPTLARLREIPAATPIGSVVMSPPPAVIDAFLPDHRIAHFLTTPAAALPGAIALVSETGADHAALTASLPDLHWIATPPEEHLRLGLLMTGSAMAAASLAYLARLRGGELSRFEAEFLEDVLDDAKRLLRLNGGDGFRAFSSVATPGGLTEGFHNAIFASKWPPEEA